jgi:hypothetical protein
MAFNDPRNANALFAREFLFKDQGNRPIAANKALLARGDGGTYWASVGSTPVVAFNYLHASSIFYSASNASSNVLWFESGVGVQFYSTIDGGQPKTWIAATGPETLRLANPGFPSQNINLNSLPNDVDTGNTLTFVGEGDVRISKSTGAVFFSAQTGPSTVSTIVGLQTETANLNSTSISLSATVSTLYEEANLFYVSTSVSSFYSTLIYTKDLAESLSTYVYSTFNVVGSTMTIATPHVFISSLTVNELNYPDMFRSTFSSIYWSSAVGVTTRTSNLYVSTIDGDNSPVIIFDNVNNRIAINQKAPPRATVDISGIVFANNFVTSSDRRLKTDVRPYISNGAPNAYNFKWIRDGTPDIGCMADEVEAIAPECVHVGGDGYKAVNYAKLVPVCFALIKGLQERVSALERQGPVM